ncbi:MAG: DNA repair protein RadC [Flavobacteriales bacterium]|nr:DNA repair protein RadC [Flavobacteriales bacterium]MCB9191906.1 DNA repair protein RadC [Flavobacteriales bacterium]
MEDYKPVKGIRSWAEDDRPREKLLLKGKSALSDAELIAILIGSGNTEETAVDLSKRILQSLNNNLSELGKLTVKDLMQFKGIGEAKAISIIAALELGRRRKDAEPEKRIKITDSRSAFDTIYPHLGDLNHEEFWVIFLNRANAVIGKQNISKGGVSGTVVDPKVVFKMAVQFPASGIILAHNHPSGNLKPSQADHQLTRKLKEAGKALDIPVLDHLIIGERDYFSFVDEGVF